MDDAGKRGRKQTGRPASMICQLRTKNGIKRDASPMVKRWYGVGIPTTVRPTPVLSTAKGQSPREIALFVLSGQLMQGDFQQEGMPRPRSGASHIIFLRG